MWIVRLRFNGSYHFLGSFADETVAAVTYDHIGCRLKQEGFPVNFPGRLLHEPFLSAANVKADRLLQSGTLPSASVAFVGEDIQHNSSQLDSGSWTSDDGNSMSLRANKPDLQHMSSLPPNDVSESEDDTPLISRIPMSTGQRKRRRASGQIAPSVSPCSQYLVWHVAKAQFRKLGPVYVCLCCRQLWFKRSVVALNSMKRKTILSNCLTGLLSKDGKEYLCTTCNQKLLKGKIPTCAPQNVPNFPVLPEPLADLTAVENHLLAPRIPFMQVCMLPRGKQFQLSGAVVNVPAVLSRVQTLLPRRFGMEETVALKLKRRLRYKGTYKFENIRPDKVMRALQWLCENSLLWQAAGISIDDDWLEHVSSYSSLENDDFLQVIETQPVATEDTQRSVPTSRASLLLQRRSGQRTIGQRTNLQIGQTEVRLQLS
jgi:hypothetical protein